MGSAVTLTAPASARAARVRVSVAAGT